MKSPLVEALRQASGNSDAAESTASRAADTETSGPGQESGDGKEQDQGEMQLLESLEILPIGGEADSTAASQDIAFDESLDLQVANDDESQGGCAKDGEITEKSAPPPPATTGPSRAPRIGLYAPFICLGVALASGATHFAYQWFVGGHENADLAVMSVKELNSPGIPPGDSLLAPPTRFKLVVDQGSARAEPGHEDRLPAGVAASGSVLP
jgi:hypothetical protein